MDDEIEALRDWPERVTYFPSDSVDRARSVVVQRVQRGGTLTRRSVDHGAFAQSPHGSDSSTRSKGLLVLAAGLVLVMFVVAGLLIFGSYNNGGKTLGSRSQTSAVDRPRVSETPGADGIPPGPAPYFPNALFDPQTPLLVGGSQTSMDQAASLVDHPLYRPNLTGDPIPQVWLVSERDEAGDPLHDVGLRYDSNLVILYGHWPSGSDAFAQYASESAQWDQGYTSTIAGNPAWVIPDSDNHLDSTESVVHVTIGSWEVQLLGRMPADQLVSIARTLHG
jgi:hypothetical protein